MSSVAFATLVGPTQTARTPRGHRPNLLDTVAHELRNPLASLRLSLDVLLNDFDELDAEAALRLVNRAQRSAAWLQTLTDNLTSVACVAAGALNVQPEPTDIRECIEEAVLLVRGLLDLRHQSVKYTCSGDAPLAMADKGRIVQVIANLLTNASRYSFDGDEIEVHVSSRGQQLRVRVTDHGPGISPADQQRIFGAWTRLEGAAPGGLGLGLSIVQSLVQQHGGRVGIDSTFGEGATFWFTLPRASVASAPVAACR
jgi:NtrC-family two-component system sensor histidine kinase KinB